MGFPFEFVWLALAVAFLVLAARGIQIVPQSEEWVLEQFGKFIGTLKPGLNYVIPLFYRVTHKVSILERQLPPHEISVITKDNVEIHLTASVFFRIVDVGKSVYRIRDVDKAVETTVTSIVRSTGGHLEFDEIQSKREYISERIRDSLSEACAVWGIEITRTEVVDVVVDGNTRSAMQLQLNAERERRAAVMRAEGERQAQQLKADGELYTAQRQAEARKMLADAEAYATRTVGEAIATNGAAAIEFEILKAQIAAITDLSKSPNTKLVVLPTDVTGTLGSLSAVLEAFRAK